MREEQLSNSRRTWSSFWFLLPALLPLCLAGQATFAESAEDAIAKIAVVLGTQATAKGAKDMAVAGFSELNGYESALTDYLTEELTTALFTTANFSVVERSQLVRVMEEHKLYASELFDPDHIADYKKLLGVDAIVTGTITRMDQQLRINARVVDMTTARVIAAAAETIESNSHIEGLLGQSGSSRRSANAIPGQVQQPSDVTYRSKTFTVTPVSVIRSDDGQSVTVTAEVRNTSSGPISVGALYGGPRTAISHGGTVLDIYRPRGISIVGRGESPTTEVLPGSTLVVQWYTVVERGEKLLGDSISLRDHWGVRTESGTQWQQVQVQFPKIMIN